MDALRTRHARTSKSTAKVRKRGEGERWAFIHENGYYGAERGYANITAYDAFLLKNE